MNIDKMIAAIVQRGRETLVHQEVTLGNEMELADLTTQSMAPAGMRRAGWKTEELSHKRKEEVRALYRYMFVCMTLFTH